MDTDSSDTDTPLDDDHPDIPHLRFLRALVTVLAGVMIVGLLVLILLIVIRFREDGTTLPALPDAITLPEGATAQAITAGPGWYMVVTDDARALVYTADGGLTGTTQLPLPE